MRPLRKPRLQPYLFVTPALVVFGVFVLYPMLATLVLSLFSWNAMSPARMWVGAANYLDLLHDKTFLVCLRNNGVWIVASLVVQLPVALLLSVAVNGSLRRHRLWRTAIFTPFVVPVVAAGLVWLIIYEPNFGMANAVLKGLTGRNIAWLGDRNLATLSIIFVAWWKYTGFHMIVLLAGLQAISDDYYQAALIDGASAWHAFRHITLPLMRRVLMVDALLIAVGCVKLFDLIWVMTGGGPYHATEVLATYMYYCGFTIDRMGYSAAVATVMVVLTLAATVVYFKLSGGEDDE
jgi:raffinose/stachyose/melibiose transport system permease protein